MKALILGAFLLAIAPWLAIALLALTSCDGGVPKLPAVSPAELKAGVCVVRAARFYGDPSKLKAAEAAQLAIDLLECAKPALSAGADAGAQ